MYCPITPSSWKNRYLYSSLTFSKTGIFRNLLSPKKCGPSYHCHTDTTRVLYPGIFLGGRGSTNSVEDRGQRERGSGGSSPLVRGSGGSCICTRNFISYSKMFVTLRLLMMTTNLFVIANVKQLQT